MDTPIWRDSPLSFELLQTLFFLADTCYAIRQENRIVALVEELIGKLAAEEGASKCALLFVLTEKAAKEEQLKATI